MKCEGNGGIRLAAWESGSGKGINLELYDLCDWICTECFYRALPFGAGFFDLTLGVQDIATPVCIERFEARGSLGHLSERLVILLLFEQNAREPQACQGHERRLGTVLHEPLKLVACGVELTALRQCGRGHQHTTRGITRLGE